MIFQRTDQVVVCTHRRFERIEEFFAGDSKVLNGTAIFKKIDDEVRDSRNGEIQLLENSVIRTEFDCVKNDTNASGSDGTTTCFVGFDEFEENFRVCLSRKKIARSIVSGTEIKDAASDVEEDILDGSLPEFSSTITCENAEEMLCNCRLRENFVSLVSGHTAPDLLRDLDRILSEVAYLERFDESHGFLLKLRK